MLCKQGVTCLKPRFFSFSSLLLTVSSRRLLTFPSARYLLFLHFHSSSHFVTDSLVFELCAFCSMICSVVSLLPPGLSLFLHLLLRLGSPPTLTYVFDSYVPNLQAYSFFLVLRNTSLIFLVTHLWSILNAPSFAPTCIFLSIPSYVPPSW